MTAELGVALWRRIPNDPARFFTEDDQARSRDFQRRFQRLRVFGLLVSSTVWIGLIAARLPQALTRRVGGPWWVRSALVLLVAGVVLSLASAQLDRAHLRLNNERGFTTLDANEISRRVLTNGLVNATVMVAVGVGVLALIRATTLWWLVLGVLLSVASVALTKLSPAFYLRRSAIFTPLDDPALRHRLSVLCRELRITVHDLLVAEGTRGDLAEPNAFVMGTGRRAEVVLTKPALKLDPPVIEAMLAHEAAHIHRRHIRPRLALIALGLPLAFFLADRVLRTRLVITTLSGLDSRRVAAAVLVDAGVVLNAALGFFWIMNALSRYQERVADLDSLQFSRDPDSVEVMFEEMGHIGGVIEASGLEYFRHSHPPLAERLELVDRWRQTRQAAVVYTDVVDSTSLVARLGDRDWLNLLGDHEAMIRSIAGELQGRVVKATGDGFLLELPDAGAAVLCAMRIQRGIRTDDAIHCRIGVHVGEFVREGELVRGTNVHMASRVMSAADADGILISEAVRDALGASNRFVIGEAQPTELKGFGVRPLFAVDWQLPDLLSK